MTTANVRPGSSVIDRRRFLQGTAAAVAAGVLSHAEHALSQSSLPAPSATNIDHIIVLMMENRSFDHYLGWLPNANGRQKGLRYLDRDGVPHLTHRLREFQGCGHSDPDHTYEGGRVEYNDGAADGWLRAGANDEFAIGYYTRKDLPFLGKAAQRWTVADRYFSSIMAPTFPNRLIQHAAQTDRIDNTFFISTLPTIWDRLAAAGLSGRYYFSDVPFLALWGSTYAHLGASIADFFNDARTGNLPNVAFVEPRFLGAAIGASGDDHPFADIRNGQAFIDLIYDAVVTSPAWPRSAFIVTYDEWGGFFDHVPPPAAPIPETEATAGNEDGLRGFRVPTLVVSPYARREFVSHRLFDHASILRMIEWRWGLDPLSVRDASANNLATAFDFSAPNLEAPRFRVPLGPFGALCVPALTDSPVGDKWDVLRGIAAASGWRV